MQEKLERWKMVCLKNMLRRCSTAVIFHRRRIAGRMSAAGRTVNVSIPFTMENWVWTKKEPDH